jgi:hypothetical protein
MMLCGREKELREIEHDCAGGSLVVIASPSGMGATKLLEEGLAARWKSEGCIVAMAREWQGRGFGNDLRTTIASAVREQADETFLEQTEDLQAMLERIRTGTGRPVALLLDQFEDYVRCHIGTELAEAFDAELARAINSHRFRIVIAIQEHSFRALQRLEQHIPNLAGARVRLGPLDEAVARELMKGLGAERGIVFEPEVVEALLSAPPAACKGGVHPFYFAMGVQRLIEAGIERKTTLVGMGVLKVFGGVDRLILESLDAKLMGLKPTHAELFFRWCNLLLSPKGERQAVTAKSLVDYSGKFNRFALTLLPALSGEGGILRTIDLPGGVRYEIARDSWAPLVRDWWKRRETDILATRRSKFRTRSISVAVGLILAMYMVYLIVSMRK